MADYKENVLKLRQEVQEAISLGTINTELYAQQVTQLLNATESVKQKAQAELERLNGLLGECRGSIKASEQMANLLIETVAAYNRQEHKRLEEEQRVAAEQAERAAAAPPTEDVSEGSKLERGKRGKRA
jgi:hypothetical protein